MLGYVAVDQLTQHVERQRPVLDDDGMEVANVETAAERLAGAVAQLEDAQLADHVAGRLAGIVEIALDLAPDIAFGEQGVLREELHALLAGPVHGVNAGVG